jgi:hypothetical protein
MVENYEDGVWHIGINYGNFLKDYGKKIADDTAMIEYKSKSPRSKNGHELIPEAKIKESLNLLSRYQAYDALNEVVDFLVDLKGTNEDLIWLISECQTAKNSVELPRILYKAKDSDYVNRMGKGGI